MEQGSDYIEKDYRHHDLKEFLGKGTDRPRREPYGRLFVSVIRGSTPGIEERFRESMLACWEEDGVTEVVLESPGESLVREYISEHHPGAEYLWEGKLDYSNWESGRPVTSTHVAGFLVSPTWDIKEPEECEHRIILDPGLAFGTGLHPTTQDSLALLRRVYEMDCPARVLDIGCGTGILSAASILLGAEYCVAVDYSLLAANATQLTIELNGLPGRIEVHHADAMDFTDREADLVLCNINFPVIEDFLEQPGIRESEWIIFSGVNPEKKHNEFIRKLAGSGRNIIECRRRNIWYSYLTSGS